MKTAHTQGKWIVKNPKTYTAAIINEIWSDLDSSECIFEINHNETSLKESLSNVKLIAAAPELLDALQDITIEVQKSCNIGNDPLLMNLLEATQNAIQVLNKLK